MTNPHRKLDTIEDWIAKRFNNPAAVSTATVRGWLRKDLIDGEKFGKRWFVYDDQTPPTESTSTGNAEADALLQQMIEESKAA